MNNANNYKNLTDNAEDCLFEIEKKYGISTQAGLVLLGISSLEEMVLKLTIEDLIAISWLGNKKIQNSLAMLIQNTINDFDTLHGLYFNAQQGSEIQNLAYIKLRSLTPQYEFTFGENTDEVKDNINKLKKALNSQNKGIKDRTSEKLLDTIERENAMTQQDLINFYGSEEEYKKHHPLEPKYGLNPSV